MRSKPLRNILPSEVIAEASLPVGILCTLSLGIVTRSPVSALTAFRGEDPLGVRTLGVGARVVETCDGQSVLWIRHLHLISFVEIYA